jgi:hypothetical protein
MARRIIHRSILRCDPEQSEQKNELGSHQIVTPNAMFKQVMADAASYKGGNKDIGVEDNSYETWSNTSWSV